MALAWRLNHDSPYNPLVEVIDLNIQLQFPMVQSVWDGKRGRWLDSWWNGAIGGSARGGCARLTVPAPFLLCCYTVPAVSEVRSKARGAI
eukprot:gene10511-499_t